MPGITNEEEIVERLWWRGKSEDEIAAILDLDVETVYGYVWGVTAR